MGKGSMRSTGRSIKVACYQIPTFKSNVFRNILTLYCIIHMYININLYSTAAQFFFFGALRWSTPPMPEFRVGDTNMLVSKNASITPNAIPKICVAPNANPQRESVEYRLRWVPNAKYLRWPCRFQVVYPFFPLWNMGYNVFMQLSCA